MTHWKKIVSDPNYLGEADFEENEEKVLTIAGVNASETVTTAEGRSQKAVLHWKEPGCKPMILNVARSKNIAKVAGTPDVERWGGVAVQLYIEHGIKAFGEVVSAVRVRPYKPRLQPGQQSQPVPPCTDCGNPIQPAMGKPAGWLAAYTTKNYGVPLCAECAQRRKEAAAEAKPEKEYGESEAAEHGGDEAPAGGDGEELL